MESLFSGAAAQLGPSSAQSAIAGLMDALGSAGLLAAGRDPGLLARIDQHVAAVRDSLTGPAGQLEVISDLSGTDRPLSLVALAAYAEGVHEAATEHGWQAPSDPLDWSDADWVLLRLLAVCALARAV